MVETSPANARDTGDEVLILGQKDPMEEEMATHSSILAWRIPRTETPGGLQSMGLQELDMAERLTLLLFLFHEDRWM